MEISDDYLRTESDETLCTSAASGDRMAEEALVMRYTRLVRICARPFFLVGGDSEDLIQEGMFGLLKAIREFDPTRDASFRTFAEVCIRNRIRSAITSASRGKHSPLNDSISIGSPLPGSAGEFTLPTQDDPESLLIGREDFQERLDNLKCQLSGFESNVLEQFLRGLSYQEIADQLCRPRKAVDNAVQRVRRKVAQHFIPGVISKG
jgi:RNA polymerase sporulation-specific sigma factor